MGIAVLFVLGQLSAWARVAPALDAGLVAAALAEKGLTCSALTPERGMTCKGRLPPEIYPEPVALIIPPGYRPVEHAELILHLHGWLESDDVTFEDTLTAFQYAELLPQTKRNALMIVPRSLGKCDTYKDRFATEQSYQAFMEHLQRLIVEAGLSGTSTPESVTLTGHSGAYRPAGSILSYAQTSIHEVYMFDSIYDDGDAFVKFASQGPPYKFYSVFIPLKTDEGEWKWTAKGNSSLWSKLNPGTSPENFIPATLPPGASPVDLQQQLARTGVVFQRSDAEHNSTFNKYFAGALRRL